MFTALRDEPEQDKGVDGMHLCVMDCIVHSVHAERDELACAKDSWVSAKISDDSGSWGGCNGSVSNGTYLQQLYICACVIVFSTLCMRT